jgi:hypothetical protein
MKSVYRAFLFYIPKEIAELGPLRCIPSEPGAFDLHFFVGSEVIALLSLNTLICRVHYT